jgi:propanol-preferring alcohol dehydrogenase
VPTYRAFEVSGSHDFALVDRELRDPGPGQVRIRVEACGVCHSDAATADIGRTEPLVPGHEVVGVIDAVGAGTTAWHVGDRVGVGFLGGQCHECERCRRGDFVSCTDQPHTGMTTDGGYAEVVYARGSGLVRIPEGIGPTDAAPLLCAGLTVYSALAKAESRPGALIAVQGIGGLGHLAVQYAKSLGYRVAAIARGTGKAALALELGADHYIDSAAADPGEALQKLGGADAIVATAASGASMSPLLPGLAPRGRLIVVGIAGDPLSVSTFDLTFGSRAVVGSLTGSSIDNEDNLGFCLAKGISSRNEVMPFAEAPAAYARMMSGAARFRVVLDMTVRQGEPA